MEKNQTTVDRNFEMIKYDPSKTMTQLAETVSNALKEKGYIIIRNFDIDNKNIEECHEKFLSISEKIGITIGHDANNKIIWDIKSNPNSDSFVKTYSEHTHEAELHTDSQYSDYPEDYFGLLTIKKASCGGGISYLLSLEQILEDIRALSDGTEIERILTETKYPFIVPNVFKKSSGEEHEFNFGPILRENEIRFRVDTFEKAIAFNGNLCTKQQVDAYKKLKKIIIENKKTKQFYLENKDLIFINNKTMLHGRSEFQDPERHLLRIRMNKKTRGNVIP